MKKLYTVADNVIIPGLSIRGPLTTPTEIPYLAVLNMVKGGYTVYQHNPYDKNSKIKVTLKNINTIRFSARDGIRTQAALAKKKEAAAKRYVDVYRKKPQTEEKRSDLKTEKYEHKKNDNNKKNDKKDDFKVNKDANKVTSSDFEQL